MVSVLTLNLWHDSPPLSSRMRLVRSWIQEHQPDLIGFQEALRGEDWCQVSEILDGLGYAISFGPAVRFWKRDDLHYGNAVASRWPIVGQSAHPLPQGHSNEWRSVLHTAIQSPWGAIRVLCTHLDNRSADNRRLQAEALVELLDAEESEATLLVGDLNASPESPELAALWGRTRDAFGEVGRGEGVTWAGINPQCKAREGVGERLDYVLADGGAQPVSCRVVLEEGRDGVWASDHFGVYAELLIGPARQGR